jgi:hypothetical protein
MDNETTKQEAGRDIPRCPLTVRELDDHGTGLAQAAGIVELVRHFIETQHWMDCTSTVPGLKDTIRRMRLEVGDVDTVSISAALHAAWSNIDGARKAIDEVGVRDACGWSADGKSAGRATS